MIQKEPLYLSKEALFMKAYVFIRKYYRQDGHQVQERP